MIFNLENEFEHDKFKEYCNEQYKKGGIVEVKRKHRQRSTSQNAYLHVLLGYFGSEFGYTLEEVKYEIFKKRVNADIFTVERTNKRGQKVKALRSSSDLSTAEMTTAIERFRNYSSAVAGLYLPEPHEDEMLIYAQQQIERMQEYL